MAKRDNCEVTANIHKDYCAMCNLDFEECKNPMATVLVHKNCRGEFTELKRVVNRC